MKPLMISAFLFILLFFMGCETTTEQPSYPSTPFEYFDSDHFDKTLSRRMRKEYPEIEVTVPNPFPVDNIPQRLDAWLTVIEKNDGEITTAPIDGVKAVDVLLELGIALYSIYQEIIKKLQYLPAKHYNATLLYRRQYKGGEAMIEKVIFTHK